MHYVGVEVTVYLPAISLLRHCSQKPQTVMWRATDHSLEPAVVVRRRAEDDGLDEEGLVAMAFLVAPDDAEAPAAWVAPPQYNLMTTVQVAAGKEQRAGWKRGWTESRDRLHPPWSQLMLHLNRPNHLLWILNL